MSTGNFIPQSTAALFDDLRAAGAIASGQDIRQHPEFRAMVAAGMDPDTPVHLLGWVDDWPARRDLAAQFAPPLSQIAPHLMGADEDIYLYRAFKEALGDYPSYVAQLIGDCFLGHTPVTMADGTRKHVGEIVVGESVLSHTGAPSKVMRSFRKPYRGNLVALDVIGPDRKTYGVTPTPDHLFWTSVINPDTGDFDWGWKAVGQLQLGDVVSRDSGSQVASVDRSELRWFEGDVYCLEVQGDHSFVANGFDVHNCTSFGSGHSLDLLQCVEMVVGKEPIDWRETCTEFIYACGREIANMLGGGDGCYGVAVAKALTDYGAVTREMVGPYDGKRAKSWGRTGAPKEWKDAAKEFKVGAAALITTCDELDAALANGYPAAGGFSQGFTMHRDADGVCRQSGRWGHEEAFVARRRRNGKRQYLLLQSWGNNVPDGPTTDDQPSYSFWVDESAMASILGQNDTLTFSKFPGFKKRPLPASFKYSADVV